MVMELNLKFSHVFDGTKVIQHTFAVEIKENYYDSI